MEARDMDSYRLAHRLLREAALLDLVAQWLAARGEALKEPAWVAKLPEDLRRALRSR